MSRKTKKNVYLGTAAAFLIAAMMFLAGLTMQSCAGKIPPISAIVATSTP